MYKAFALLVLGVIALVGCGRSQPETEISDEFDVVGATYLVDKEPADVKPVAEAIQAADDKSDVTMVGRIGGAINPWVDDLAAFTIVDPSLQACSDIPGDNCPTPWDYCCDQKNLKTHSVMVKFVDEKGSVVPVDARKLFDVEPLQTVVVKGHLQKDSSGKTALIAEKMFVRKQVMNMNAQVDLKRLAVHRETAATRAIGPPRRIWSRYVMPAAMIAGLLGVIAWAARDSLLPSRDVTVMPVAFSEGTVSTEGAPLFKAAGWVEPRPTAVQVTALAEGVVERLSVIEGERVEKGQEVARLIDRDAELALDEAKVEVELRQAELASAQAALEAAQITFTYPVQLQAELAESEAMLARAQNELDVLPLQIRAAEASCHLAQQDYDGKSEARDAVSGRSLQRAKNELAASRAMLEELLKKQPRVKREVEAQERRRDALQKQLELKTDETRALAEAKAAIAIAQARVHHAEIAASQAKLRYDRMKVVAPSEGIVLALVAPPGKRVMGQSAVGEPEASTVVTLYDPERLQVRADVRLEDVPKVQPGQRVQIETPSAGKPLTGEVLAITSLTDIQKNTLQVKVTIENPPDRVKPEMLVQVTFLAPKSDAADKAASKKMRVFVPRSLVEGGESGTNIWVADLTGRVARRKPIQLGASLPGGLVEVEGLTPADKLIINGREGLSDGERIRVSDDHTSHQLLTPDQ